MNVAATHTNFPHFPSSPYVQDIVVSLVLVVGFVVSGLTQAVCGGKLKKSDEVWWKETAAATVSHTFHPHIHTVRYILSYVLWQPRWLLFAHCASLESHLYPSQVLSFVCAVLAGLLALWSLLFIVRRWYYKILQYMSLP